MCLNKAEVRPCEHGSLINRDVPQKVRAQLKYGQIYKTLSAQWRSISLNIKQKMLVTKVIVPRKLLLLLLLLFTLLCYMSYSVLFEVAMTSKYKSGPIVYRLYENRLFVIYAVQVVGLVSSA
jgi:hypothetical protein